MSVQDTARPETQHLTTCKLSLAVRSCIAPSQAPPNAKLIQVWQLSLPNTSVKLPHGTDSWHVEWSYSGAGAKIPFLFHLSCHLILSCIDTAWLLMSK